MCDQEKILREMAAEKDLYVRHESDGSWSIFDKQLGVKGQKVGNFETIPEAIDFVNNYSW